MRLANQSDSQGNWSDNDIWEGLELGDNPGKSLREWGPIQWE